MTYQPTYSNLIAQVSSHVEDDSPEFLAEMPNILARAEDRVHRELNLEFSRKTFTTTLSSGASEITLPADAIKVTEVRAGNAVATNRSDDYVRAYTGSGVPRYFAHREDGAKLTVAPVPSESTSLHVRYLARPAGLSAQNETTWLSRNVGDLLFHACLIGAASFLKMQERKAEFEADYQSRLVVVLQEIRGTAQGEYGRVDPST